MRCCRSSQPGDILIDGGNSDYRDDMRRAKDAGCATGFTTSTSAPAAACGAWSAATAMMIGGDADTVAHLDPIFAALAPGVDGRTAHRGRGSATRRRARDTAEQGYLHCGAVRRRPLRQDGAQRHRVRLDGGVRRGAEHPAPRQRRQRAARSVDAETTPLAEPELYQLRFRCARASPRCGGAAASCAPGCST